MYTVKGFVLVNKAEVDVFLELSFFFSDPTDAGNLISGSSVVSKTSFKKHKNKIKNKIKPALTSGSSWFTYC